MKRELDAKLKLIDLFVGVKIEIGLALVPYLDVITRDTLLHVPGTLLPSCCNMAVIYIINHLY